MTKAEIIEKQIELYEECITLFQKEIVKAHSDYVDFESKCKADIETYKKKIEGLEGELEDLSK